MSDNRQGQVTDQMTDPIRERLAPFFEANPECGYKCEEGRSIIVKPWADETVELRVPEEPDELIEALNASYLPPRLTAIWHKDTQDLEFIYAPLAPQDDLRSRKFEFRYQGVSYQCEYGDSSRRLIVIANSHRAIGPPAYSMYRNLIQFRVLRHYVEERPGSEQAKRIPTSFWIRGIHWEENKVIDLARSLNFHMSYFDRRSPHIVIHEHPATAEEAHLPERYPIGKFPPVISAKQVDDYLLGLWESAVDAADSFRKFLYRYQILEYAAFYYMQEDILMTIRRVLASPETPSRLDEASHQIVDALASDKMRDEAKIVAVVKQLVDPEMIWKEIEPNKQYFSTETVFDGGFVLRPLLRPDWSIDDFKSTWIPSFPDALRSLRNGLVHARESRMSGVIAPTRANHSRLRPWLEPISVAAVHAMLYR